MATTGRPRLTDYVIASPTIEEFVAFRLSSSSLSLLSLSSLPSTLSKLSWSSMIYYPHFVIEKTVIKNNIVITIIQHCLIVSPTFNLAIPMSNLHISMHVYILDLILYFKVNHRWKLLHQAPLQGSNLFSKSISFHETLQFLSFGNKYNNVAFRNKFYYQELQENSIEPYSLYQRQIQQSIQKKRSFSIRSCKRKGTSNTLQTFSPWSTIRCLSSSSWSTESSKPS